MRKLAEEAGLYVKFNEKPWPRAMSAEECNEAYSEFAKSIVQECVDICYKQIVGAVGSYPSAHNNAVDACVKNIKEHFGIK